MTKASFQPHQPLPAAALNAALDAKADIDAAGKLVETQLPASVATGLANAQGAASSALTAAQGAATDAATAKFTAAAQAAAVAVNTAAIAAEVSARGAGDTTNANAISAEVTARTAAVSAEATARANADTAEATARSNADTTNATAIAAEASARGNAVSAEATARAAVDALLVPLSTVGKVGGPAGPLDANGKIPSAQMGTAASIGSAGPDAFIVFQGWTVSSTGAKTSSTPVIVASKNVSALDHIGQGLWAVTFTTAFADANYLVHAMGKFGLDARDGTQAVVCEPRSTPSTVANGYDTATASKFTLVTNYTGGGTASTDIFLVRASFWKTSA